MITKNRQLECNTTNKKNGDNEDHDDNSTGEERSQTGGYPIV